MSSTLTGRSYKSAVAITPHDTNANSYSAIYVGGAGNITLRGVKDSADTTLIGVPVGTVLELNVSHIRATNTNATNLVGFRN